MADGMLITQTCQMCSTKRGLPGVEDRYTQRDGWRQPDLGSRKPWLCPECLNAVRVFIAQGPADG